MKMIYVVNFNKFTKRRRLKIRSPSLLRTNNNYECKERGKMGLGITLTYKELYLNTEIVILF